MATHDLQHMIASGRVSAGRLPGPMNALKNISLIIMQRVKQIRSLPQTIAKIVEQRRLQIVLDAREAERLDRIRNPSKYRGK